MPWTNEGKNAMLAASGITHAAVYDGDPSGAGTQIGSRQAITFNTPSAGSMDQVSAAIDFAVGAGETVDHVAYFTASSGGEMRAYDPVTSETFTAAGTYRLTESVLDLNS